MTDSKQSPPLSFSDFKKLHAHWCGVNFENMGDYNLLRWKLFYAMGILGHDIEQ